MKILITGGSGLVGTAINSYSKQSQHQFISISSKDCDLTNLQATIELFNKHKPDYVIHLAAFVGGVFRNEACPVDMYEKNITMNLNVLKCSHDFKVKKLISCLSTCIFPNDTIYPIREEMLHNGAPYKINEGYGYSKRMVEVHSRAYKQQYGDDFICVTPTNIYGENDNYHLINSHVIPALIHNCYIAKRDGTHFVVKGTGTPLRQFVYSSDLAKLILLILDKQDCPDQIILSPNEDEEVSIRDVATIIAKEFDYDDMIRFDSNYTDGQIKKTVSNDRLMNLFPDFKFTTLQEGLHNSVTWFIDNINTIRT